MATGSAFRVPLHLRPRVVAQRASLVSAFIGVFVLAGWQSGLFQRAAASGILVPMKPNAAIEFVLLGGSLFLILSPSRKFTTVARILSAIALAIAGLTVAEYMFGVEFGLDQLLYADASVPFPGRIPPIPAANFLAVALAILLLDARRAWPSITLATIVAFTVLVAFTGRAFQAFDLYLYGVYYAPTAPLSVVGLGLLVVGILLGREDHGLARLTAIEGPAGLFTRRLIPAVTFGPLLLGWFVMMGQRLEGLQSPLTFAIFAVLAVGMLIGLVVDTAIRIDRADRLQRGLERDLLETHRLAAERAAYLAALVENSDDAIVGAGLDGIIRSWNPGAERLFGYSAEEAIGRRGDELFPLDDRTEAAELLSAPHLGDVARDVEMIRTRKDGRRVDVSVTISPLYDEARHVVGMSSVARDITPKKVVERAFREVSEFHRQIIQSAQVGIAVFDRNLRYVLFNPYMERLTGRSADDLIGAHPAEIAAPAAVDELVEDLRRVLDGGFVRRDEVALPSLHDEPRWVAEELTPLTIGGNVTGVIQIVRDITERVQVEAALRESSRFSEEIIQSAQDGIVVVDRDFRYLVWNSCMERMFGIPAKAVLGKRPEEVFPTQSLDELNAARRRVLAGETLVSDDTEYRIPETGREGWVSTRFTPFRNADGEIAGVLSMVSDITARKRVEQTLRDNEGRIQFALEAAKMGIWEQDLESGAVTWSPTMAPLFGIRPEEFDGTDAAFFNRVAAADREQVRKTVDEAVQLRDDFTIEFRCEWPTGDVHWLFARGRIMRDFAGRPIRVLGVAMDVTERHSLEAQFRQAQKMEAVGQLAGGVAHDFNNLLTAILGYAKFLAESVTDEDQVRDVQEIVRAADRAAGLTRQLLSFSRRQILETEIINLNGVIREMSNMVRRLIGEHIELSMSLSADLGAVKADKGQLEQVVMNLVVNARDAMPNGGRLELTTSNVDLDEKSLVGRAAVNPGRYVMLAVTDSGMGMSDETKSRIFEPFFTTKTRDKGTGLGLSTVYGIVSQSGGYLWVYSELQRGTSFKVYLPRVEQLQAREQAADLAPRAIGGTECVLLVEDEEAVRFLARVILERAGYRVVDASNPREAEQIFERIPDVDLLVTDVIMPGGTGTDLFQRLGRRASTLRVLFMSGYTGDAVFDQSKIGPGAAFLEKPFTAAGLVGKVREVLDR